MIVCPDTAELSGFHRAAIWYFPESPGICCSILQTEWRFLYMFELILSVLAGFSVVMLSSAGGNKFPKPLPHEEEKELFRRARLEGDEKAREQLIEHNLRLVAHIVRKYYSSHPSEEDLVSIGTIGLIKSVDSFNIENGARFATYAAKCIQNAILSWRLSGTYSERTDRTPRHACCFAGSCRDTFISAVRAHFPHCCFFSVWQPPRRSAGVSVPQGRRVVQYTAPHILHEFLPRAYAVLPVFRASSENEQEFRSLFHLISQIPLYAERGETIPADAPQLFWESLRL